MLSLVESYNKANILLGLMEYELNSLLGASHLVDYISVHIRFNPEIYLLNRQGEIIRSMNLFNGFGARGYSIRGIHLPVVLLT